MISVAVRARVPAGGFARKAVVGALPAAAALTAALTAWHGRQLAIGARHLRRPVSKSMPCHPVCCTMPAHFAGQLQVAGRASSYASEEG